VTKILVTGSKGFIGSRVLSYLQEKGQNAVGTSEEIRNIETLRPHFKGVEFVIHTAGKKYNPLQEEDFYTINVLGTGNVAQLCLENDSKLIHLGSIATDGPYGVSKQQSQKLVEDYCNRKGLRAIVLRLCVIYTDEKDSKKRGARYPLERLVVDIENMIKNHDFSKYKLVDYSNTRA